MKTGIVIIARVQSTRLPKKHLIPIEEKPILAYLIDRIRAEFKRELAAGSAALILAAPDDAENRELESLGNRGLEFTYGSADNIPLRQVQAAEKFGLDAVVSVDGDDILCSVEGMRKVADALAQGVSYVKTGGLPIGMNSHGYSFEFLQQCTMPERNNTLETGWKRIFEEGECLEVPFAVSAEEECLRFTLDYPEDFEFFKAVILGLGDSISTATDRQIIDYAITSGAHFINSQQAEEYAKAFEQGMAEEIRKARERQ